MRYGTWASFVVVGSLVFGVACGGDADDEGKGNTVDGGGGTTQLPSGSGGAPVLGNGGGPAAVTCKMSSDCTTGANTICHPWTGKCVAPEGNCAGMSECAAGRYCDTELKVCLPATSGSPCETAQNCAGGAVCSAEGSCGCSEFTQQQPSQGGPLDVYFLFDRTSSMLRRTQGGAPQGDCAYVPGGTPPEDTKGCYATYALPDYLTSVSPEVETRLAFQFLSLEGGCDGGPYSTPLVPLTQLPVTADHEMIQAISDETFDHDIGTDLEGALRGIAAFTAANQTEGREMIGVLMTDGDPTANNNNSCQSETNIGELEDIIAEHYAATGIRIFIIGMEGATEQNLERLATAGGADPHDDYCGDLEPPCHYWNVGNGSGEAVADALTAIQEQAAPLPCEYPISQITPPAGSTLDLTTLNIRLNAGGVSTTVVQTPSEAECPTDQDAWYYDTPTNPTKVHLCPKTCSLVTGTTTGAQVSVVAGCNPTEKIK
jgi:hypothetical protein